MRFFKQKARVLQWSLLACFMLMAGCGDGDREPLQVDIGKSNPDRLLRFYFGSYVADGVTDPFEAGLLTKEGGRYYLNSVALPDGIAGQLKDVDGNGVLDWDELEPFLQQTYYDVRPMPATLADLKTEAPFGDNEKWMVVEIDGVMTTARRKVYVARDAVEHALQSYEANKAILLYPEGTVMIGEHWEGTQVVETTMMKKREDGFWDYAVYDDAGNLTGSTTTPPRQLTVPTRCVGCHFGEKKFEPENSYPFQAAPGPSGPRAIHGPASAADTVLVNRFNEHVKRSDTILGIYATLYLSELARRLDAGQDLGEREQQILKMHSN